MGNELNIKVYQNFINDLRDETATLDLFYYFLSINPNIDESSCYFSYKTDEGIDSNFEPKVKSHAGDLHLLSTDIIDDTILVSKLVDPYILVSDIGRNLYVMYRLTIGEDSTYHLAYKLNVNEQLSPQGGSKITANDYNYLYFDLTEFGSVLAKIRLNNTSPIYETSHAVDGDSRYIGSGAIDRHLQGPRSVDKIDLTKDNEISQSVQVQFRNNTQDARKYTEEFYHMGDFTIRLLGKKLQKARIDKGQNTYDSTFNDEANLENYNLVTTLYPTEPNKRTLKYLSFNDLRNGFIPRIDNKQNSLCTVRINSDRYNKYINIITFTTKVSGGCTGLSFILDDGAGRQETCIALKNDDNRWIFDYDRSSSYGGLSTSVNTYVEVLGEHHDKTIKIWIKADASCDGKDICVLSAYKDLAGSTEVTFFDENDPSQIITSSDTPQGFNPIRTSSISVNPIIRTNSISINSLNSNNVFSFDLSNYAEFSESEDNLDGANRIKLIRKMCTFELPELRNNVIEFTNGVNKGTSNAEYFDANRCVALHNYNNSTGGIPEIPIISSNNNNLSNLLNIIVNNSDGDIEVEISILNESFKIKLHARSVFAFTDKYTSGFIRNVTDSCIIINDTNTGTLIDPQYCENSSQFIVDNGVVTSRNINLNIDTVMKFINNSEVTKTVNISTYQCRHLVKNNIKYGNQCQSTLTLIAPPHSLSVVNSTSSSTYELYQIPVYYSNT